MAEKQLTLEVGSDRWKQLREWATEPIPGKRSALYFLCDKILGLGELVPLTYFAHWAMCLFTESATGIKEIDDARVKLILVPRGLGKSTIITKGYALQQLLKNDDYSIGIANEKQDLANAFLAQIKSEFETNSLVQALWPERIPNFKETTWASDRIILARKKPNPTSPSVLAAGVGSTVTGVHLDEWIVDDIISQNAAENALRGSYSEIESTNRWISRLQPLLKSPKRDPIKFVGTKWWAGDSYEYIESFWGHNEEKKEFLWQLTLPDGQRQSIILYRVGELAVFKRPAIENGRSIFPERYTLEDLDAMRQEDPVFFAGQYLLEPTTGAASEFDEAWLKEYDEEGNALVYKDERGRTTYVPRSDLICVMSLDPAFSDSHSAARTAIPVTGIADGRIFLLEDFAERGLGVEDIAHKAVDFIIRYRPRKFFIETITAQVAVADAVRRVARERNLAEAMLSIEEIKSHGKQRKQMRIYGLEPYFRKGLFYMHRRHQNFRSEYMTFPRGQFRDILDALSFQREEWEKLLAFSTTGGYNPYDLANRNTLARLRASARRRR